MGILQIGKTNIETVSEGSLRGAKLDYVQSFAFALLQPVDNADVPNGSIFYSSDNDALVYKSHVDGTIFEIMFKE